MIIEDVITKTLTWARPSDGDNLLGFEIDAEHAFEETGLFESVSVRTTNDPRRLLVMREGGVTLEALAGALTEAWQQYLVYRGFEASAIELHRDRAVMRFVTATPDGDLCVTGEVNASLRRMADD
jgi:hypothetical protein